MNDEKMNNKYTLFQCVAVMCCYDDLEAELKIH